MFYKLIFILYVPLSTISQIVSSWFIINYVLYRIYTFYVNLFIILLLLIYYKFYFIYFNFISFVYSIILIFYFASLSFCLIIKVFCPSSSLLSISFKFIILYIKDNPPYTFSDFYNIWILFIKFNISYFITFKCFLSF